MSDIETTTVSESGYQFTSDFSDFELVIDAVGDDGPRARDALLATYASCFQGAYRVGAEQRGHNDLGQLRTNTVAEVDEDDHLKSIQFSIYVEADLDEDESDEILNRAKDICHVHDALREELKADIEIHPDAF